MGLWQGRAKRVKTGKKVRPYRKKKKYEIGSLPTATLQGDEVVRKVRGRGKNSKLRMLKGKMVNISVGEGMTKRVEIQDVLENPASVDFNRRGVITKGAFLKTELGRVRVTSRPGRDGLINGILLED
ncbi:MAG: 30S ribosomal protein S8e [Candidatus Ranarchaeia archaeon]